jgi:hypothetical protein
MTCCTVGASAYYVQHVVGNARTQYQYVMAGSPNLHYLSPDLKVETPTEMHVAQTRLAMETIYNRTPTQPDNQSRLGKLFTDEARVQIVKGLISPQAKDFLEKRFHQKVELGEIAVNIQEGKGTATTVATAQLIRVGVTETSTINETWSVRSFFTWKSNPDFKTSAMFPTICDSVTFFSTERISP